MKLRNDGGGGQVVIVSDDGIEGGYSIRNKEDDVDDVTE